MKLLIESSEKEAFRSLSDDHVARLPDLALGDIIPVSVAILGRIFNQFNQNLFAPIDVSGYTIRVALGSFLPPIAGTFPLTYAAETGVTLASFDPTAVELEDILNSISTVAALGGVDVIGSEGLFVITWRLVGARELIVASASDLVPVSLITIARTVTGAVATREVQTLQIRQDVGAIATLSTASSSPSITVTLVVQGDATHNHQVRLTFPPNQWGGVWTFSANSGESDVILFSPTAEQMQGAIEAIAAIGTGNVSVTQETENVYLVTFTHGRGLQAITGVAADGTTLKVIGTKSGSLDLTAAKVGFLIPPGETQSTVTLEVEATPSGGSAEKVLERDVILRRSII